MPFFIPKLVVGGKALAGVIKAGAAASKAGKAYAAGATVKASGLTAAKTATTAAKGAYAAAGGTKALVGNALGSAAMIGGGVAAYNWDMNRRVNNALNNAGVAGSQPGATGEATFGPEGPMFDMGAGGGDFGAGYGNSPMAGNPGVVGMPQGAMAVSGQGAEIAELRRQLARVTDETNALYRAMNDTCSILTDMSNTINAQSDMGRGLANLSNNAAELSRQGVQDLTTIINFMDERIRTSEAGIAESSSTLAGLNSEMSSVNWFN